MPNKLAANRPAILTVLTGTHSIHRLEKNINAMENPTLSHSDKERCQKVFGEISVYI